jgi:hypothetical protein
MLDQTSTIVPSILHGSAQRHRNRTLYHRRDRYDSLWVDTASGSRILGSCSPFETLPIKILNVVPITVALDRRSSWRNRGTGHGLEVGSNHAATRQHCIFRSDGIILTRSPRVRLHSNRCGPLGAAKNRSANCSYSTSVVTANSVRCLA